MPNKTGRQKEGEGCWSDLGHGLQVPLHLWGGPQDQNGRTGTSVILERKLSPREGLSIQGYQGQYPGLLMPEPHRSQSSEPCVSGQSKGLTQCGGVSRSRKLWGRTRDMRLYLAMSSRICKCVGFATKKVCAAAAARSNFFI